MSSEILSNNEESFMNKCVEQGLRIDGRKLNEYRDIKIDFGLNPGSVGVCLGKTRCYVTINCELSTPNYSKPNEGIIEYKATFPNYLNKSQYDSHELTTIIEKGIKQSNAIDLESLCVLANEKVWIISVNICIIQMDGNIIDCANIGVISALKHHRRPDVQVIGNQITVYSMLDRHPVPLSIHHIPICITLAHIQINNNIYTIIDPNMKEELLSDGLTTYCMTKYKQLCSVNKIGGIPISIDEFLKWINTYVISVVNHLTNLIENKLIQAKLDDPRKRKLMLTNKVVDPIKLFKPNPIKNNNDVDIDLIDFSDDNDLDKKRENTDKLLNEWMEQQEMKMDIMLSNLNNQSSGLEYNIDTNQTSNNKE